MVLNKTILACLVCVCSKQILASDLGCKPYYQQPKNVLVNVTIVAADTVADNNTFAVPATHEAWVKSIKVQEWDLNLYQDKRLFAKCCYHDDSALIKPLPKRIKHCTLRVSRKIKLTAAKFACAKK